MNWFFSLVMFFGLGPPWTWKKAFFLLLIMAIIIIVPVLYLLYQKNKDNHDLSQTINQRDSEIESLKAEITKKDNRFKILGVDVESEGISSRRTVDEFIRDWDTSDFYIVDSGTFCPKDKGKYNFQRMFYKFDTPFAASELSLKFQMADQFNETTDYLQRVVIGMKLYGEIFSEYDVPTRDRQVVNFRVASESGELVSGGEGKPISSPIKDKSTINIKFQTKSKHGQEITQIIELDYVSAVDEYGEENKSISYDAKVNDSRPETARANLFIGSYIGGCVKIIDWHAN